MPAFLAIKLFLGGAVQKLVQWLSHRSFWQIVCMALIALLIVQRFELSRSRAEAAKWHTQFTDEHSGRLADRQAYQRAQQDAVALNKVQVAKVEQQYQGNSDATKDAYARDHAELVRLRQQRDAAAKGSPGSAAPSQDHAAASGSDGHGVPVSPGDDLQTKDAAADIELRLMHLQNFVEGLLKVDPNER